VVGSVLIPTSAGKLTVTMSGYDTAPGLPETLTGVSLPRGPYRISGLPAAGTVLAPRHAVTLSVDFDPRRAGTYSSRLGLMVDGHASEVPITGTALAGRVWR
jgi:hypothetical protein